ncbi:hypothetical protein N7478_012361 [Penicillium angulare]|uniref:uncharacterized protein n=1 Tax=Penicillium angulare TaxID=116970 RepID=UPI00253FCB51|nr:uncharacterized protein N7478_012361 [Penicillium angulare]KAJ5259380.1 hypothetical protein N7478_012361 [Penicillium angulare]
MAIQLQPPLATTSELVTLLDTFERFWVPQSKNRQSQQSTRSGTNSNSTGPQLSEPPARNHFTRARPLSTVPPAAVETGP